MGGDGGRTEVGRRQGTFHESWSLSMERVSLCYSIESIAYSGLYHKLPPKSIREMYRPVFCYVLNEIPQDHLHLDPPDGWFVYLSLLPRRTPSMILNATLKSPSSQTPRSQTSSQNPQQNTA